MSEGGFADVRRFATLGSTNAYLLEKARRGAPAGAVAVTDHQTAGRGRLGRRWEAPPGTCLLVSVLLRPVLEPDRLHLGTALVALAAADACQRAAGVVPAVKWPNDLLSGGRKLAGVLAESDPAAPGGPPGSVAVVVGVGVNVTWPGPEGAGGTSLSDEAGRPVDREVVLAAFLAAMRRRSPALGSPAGRRALAGELRRRCSTVGSPVRVALAGRQVVGTAVDLTDAGHLVVETAAGGGREEVAAGDVVHLRPSGDAPGAR